MRKEVEEEGSGGGRKWRRKKVEEEESGRKWIRMEVKSCSQLRWVYKLNLVKTWCITETYHKLSMHRSRGGGRGARTTLEKS